MSCSCSCSDNWDICLGFILTVIVVYAILTVVTTTITTKISAKVAGLQSDNIYHIEQSQHLNSYISNLDQVDSWAEQMFKINLRLRTLSGMQSFFGILPKILIEFFVVSVFW